MTYMPAFDGTHMQALGGYANYVGMYPNRMTINMDIETAKCDVKLYVIPPDWMGKDSGVTGPEVRDITRMAQLPGALPSDPICFIATDVSYTKGGQVLEVTGTSMMAKLQQTQSNLLLTNTTSAAILEALKDEVVDFTHGGFYYTYFGGVSHNYAEWDSRGKSVYEALKIFANAEGCYFRVFNNQYPDPGTVHYPARLTLIVEPVPTSVTATLTTGAEILGEPDWSTDQKDITNDIILQCNGFTRSVANSAVYRDTNSVAAYGLCTKRITRLEITTTAEADRYAAGLIAKYKNPRTICKAKVMCRVQTLIGQEPLSYFHPVGKLYTIVDTINNETANLMLKSVKYDSSKGFYDAEFTEPTLSLQSYLTDQSARISQLENSVSDILENGAGTGTLSALTIDANKDWNNKSITNLNQLTVASTTFPVLDVTRTTNASQPTGVFGGMRFTRVCEATPTNNVGIGLYLLAPNSSKVSKYCGIVGGRLGSVTPGSEIGEIVLAPSYAGGDASSRSDLVVRAINATKCTVSVNGALTAELLNGIDLVAKAAEWDAKAAGDHDHSGVYSPAAHTHSVIFQDDTRGSNYLPNDAQYNFAGHRQEFKNRTTVGLPGSNTYASLLTVSQWTTSGGGGGVHQLAFNDNNGLLYRWGGHTSTSWDAWRRICLLDASDNVPFANLPTGTGSSQVSVGNHVQGVTVGGTGLTSIATGGILYASSSNTLSRIAPSAANQVLRSTASNALQFAALVAGDIPPLDAGKISSGTLNISRIPTGSTSSTVALGNHTHPTAAIYSPGGLYDGASNSRTSATEYTYNSIVPPTGYTCIMPIYTVLLEITSYSAGSAKLRYKYSDGTYSGDLLTRTSLGSSTLGPGTSYYQANNRKPIVAVCVVLAGDGVAGLTARARIYAYMV